MRSAKKREAEPEIVLTPEQEALLDEGLAALERGDYIEIEIDENTTSVVAEIRRRLHDTK